MTSQAIIEIEKKQMRQDIPQFIVGDTIAIMKAMLEGKKKRLQKFEGIVIKIQGGLSRTNVTLRRIIDGIGVEKTFLIHSPLIEEIKVVRHGKARKAKLHYLRERIGVKATRVKARKVNQNQASAQEQSMQSSMPISLLPACTHTCTHLKT
jgi:large subunit ribosomal protein L19